MYFRMIREVKKVRLASTDLFLGTSFKRVKPLVPLDTIFTFSKRVSVIAATEINHFLQFYKDFKVRENITKTVNPPLDKKTLLKDVQTNDSHVFVIKDSENLLLGGLVVSLLKLPRPLNQQYFGNDFERFIYVHKLCYQKDCECVISELISHVALEFEDKGIKAAMAHVWPQHKELCDRILQKPFFKRVSGENYFSEDTLICLDLS